MTCSGHKQTFIRSFGAMNELERLKAESERLDAIVEAVGTTDRSAASQRIRKVVLDSGHTLSVEDECALCQFAAGKIGFASLANRFQGRI